MTAFCLVIRVRSEKKRREGTVELARVPYIHETRKSIERTVLKNRKLTIGFIIRGRFFFSQRDPADTYHANLCYPAHTSPRAPRPALQQVGHDEAPTKRGADAPGAHAHGGAPHGRARGRRRVQRQRGPRAGEQHRRHRQRERWHRVPGRAAHAREAVQQRGRRADRRRAVHQLPRGRHQARPAGARVHGSRQDVRLRNGRLLLQVAPAGGRQGAQRKRGWGNPPHGGEARGARHVQSRGDVSVRPGRDGLHPAQAVPHRQELQELRDQGACPRRASARRAFLPIEGTDVVVARANDWIRPRRCFFLFSTRNSTRQSTRATAPLSRLSAR